MNLCQTQTAMPSSCTRPTQQTCGSHVRPGRRGHGALRHRHGAHPAASKEAGSARLVRCQANDQDSEAERSPSSMFLDRNKTPPPSGPAFQDGVNWFCYSTIGLITLTDFSPAGLLLQSSSNAPLVLAAMQWLFFLAPTAYHTQKQGWGLARVFKLQPCTPLQALQGAGAGVLTWVAVMLALYLRTGVPFWEAAAGGADASPLLSSLFSRPDSTAGWLQLLATTAVSPAIAEELLFRGYLMTSLEQRLGSVDRVAVSGALFAAIHLSAEQFFPFALLGFACGAAATASGSIYPAILLHMSYNMAALLVGLHVI